MMTTDTGPGATVDDVQRLAKTVCPEANCVRAFAGEHAWSRKVPRYAARNDAAASASSAALGLAVGVVRAVAVGDGVGLGVAVGAAAVSVADRAVALGEFPGVGEPPCAVYAE